MRAVVITVRYSLSVVCASSKKIIPQNLGLETTRVRMFATRNRREAPHHRAQRGHIASGKWLQFLLNRSQSMGLLASFCVGYTSVTALRAAGGAFQLSCNGARGGAAWVREAWSGHLVPQISLSLALLGRPRWWLLLWLQYGTSWQRWMA